MQSDRISYDFVGFWRSKPSCHRRRFAFNAVVSVLYRPVESAGDLRQPTGDFFYGCGLPPSPSLRPAKFFSNVFTALSLRYRTSIKPRRFQV